jgi:Helix-turn-helix of DDE superfamily endonuclease
MYHTTGLDKAEILDLCEIIHRDAAAGERNWPPILGLYKSVVVTLTYLRRNRVQAEIGETFDVSQPTISRAITAITGLLERALRKYVPTADELDDRKQYVVDGVPRSRPATVLRERVAPSRRCASLGTPVAGTLLGKAPSSTDADPGCAG